MISHTQGPWVVYDDGPDGSDVILAHLDEENYDIAYIADERPEDEKKANARLIAAAPDLLVCLEDFVAAYMPADGGDLSWEALNNVLQSAVEILAHVKG